MEKENWPNLTHQSRDKLLALCQEAGVDCTDKWLSEAAVEAITALRDRLARLEAAAKEDVALDEAETIIARWKEKCDMWPSEEEIRLLFRLGANAVRSRLAAALEGKP